MIAFRKNYFRRSLFVLYRSESAVMHIVDDRKTRKERNYYEFGSD